MPEVVLFLCIAIIAGAISWAQPTYDYQGSESCQAVPDMLAELKQSVIARCTAASDVTALLADLRSNMASGLAVAERAPRTCNCSCGNDIKDLLTSLRADVTAVKDAIGTAAASHVPRRNASSGGECFVDMLSWGCNDGVFKGGHVRANWTNVHYFGVQGVFTAILDPVTCTGSPFPALNPAASADQANHLITYINLLTPGQILIAATGNEPQRNLNRAYPALASIGVNLNRLARCGKFAFIVQKGQPNKTVMAMASAAAGNLWLVVKVEGSTMEDVKFTKLNP